MKKTVLAILATDARGCIGVDGDLLVKDNPIDMGVFVKVTGGLWWVMGRKTFLTMPPAALNRAVGYVVLTSKSSHELRELYLERWKTSPNMGITVFSSVGSLRAMIEESHRDYAIIGGKSVYEGLMSIVTNLIVTLYNHKDLPKPNETLVDLDLLRLPDTKKYQIGEAVYDGDFNCQFTITERVIKGHKPTIGRVIHIRPLLTESKSRSREVFSFVGNDPAAEVFVTKGMIGLIKVALDCPLVALVEGHPWVVSVGITNEEPITICHKTKLSALEAISEFYDNLM